MPAFMNNNQNEHNDAQWMSFGQNQNIDWRNEFLMAQGFSRNGGQTLVQSQAPNWSAPLLTKDGIRHETLESFKGNSWLVMFFYPRDFSMLCGSELRALSDIASQFEKYNCKIVAVSTDSVQSHKAFGTLPHEQNGLGQFSIPLVSDFNKVISA
jgi:peroxiredoxin 2/4